jgi:anti-sigma regulatory factor (Ser/Thr protein kinase)
VADFEYNSRFTTEVVEVGFEPREHSIRAELAHLKGARDFAVNAAEEFGLDDEASYNVRLAMSEAVTNAIRHGSSSADDPITILALVEGDALVFEVADTGRFIPRVTRRGELPERGRGLEFIRQLMDEVHVSPGADGTRVRFAKRRDAR